MRSAGHPSDQLQQVQETDYDQHSTTQLACNDDNYSPNVIPDHEGLQSPTIDLSRWIQLLPVVVRHL